MIHGASIVMFCLVTIKAFTNSFLLVDTAKMLRDVQCCMWPSPMELSILQQFVSDGETNWRMETSLWSLTDQFVCQRYQVLDGKSHLCPCLHPEGELYVLH